MFSVCTARSGCVCPLPAPASVYTCSTKTSHRNSFSFFPLHGHVGESWPEEIIPGLRASALNPPDTADHTFRGWGAIKWVIGQVLQVLATRYLPWALSSIATEMKVSSLNHQLGAFQTIVSAMTVRYSDPLLWYQVASFNPLISFYSYLRNKEYHQLSKWPGLEELRKATEKAIRGGTTAFLIFLAMF